MAKKYIGIDIGSTASKVCVLEEGKDPVYEVLPTGWNSKITAGIIKDDLIKRYGDIEFLNKVKEMWIVRCIERDHEEDGVKFWLFNSSKKKDGVYDKIMNLAKIRAQNIST